jgi:PhnB protein
MAAKKKISKAAGAVRAAIGKATRKVAGKVAGKVAPKRRAKVQPIPKGYHVVTPSIVVRGATEALEFYKKAFGAKELARMPGPDGKVLHAEFKIGDSIVMLSDEFPQMGSSSPQTVGGTASSLMIYTRDVDALFNQAVAAGAQAAMPVSDMFWGDRYGKVVDPFGHHWALATRKENVSAKEMARRATSSMSAPPQE